MCFEVSAGQITNSDNALGDLELSDTTVLTPATTLKAGLNTIKVDNAALTSNLLVWVSMLGQVDGKSGSDIAEITLKAAS